MSSKRNENRDTSARGPNANRVSSNSGCAANGIQSDTMPADSATGSSDVGSHDETDQQKCDPEFEAELQDFARLLERSCAQKLANHARKLRPNYEEQWILKLKLRLQTLESKKQPA